MLSNTPSLNLTCPQVRTRLDQTWMIKTQEIEKE
jgi:hypothetical protein